MRQSSIPGKRCTYERIQTHRSRTVRVILSNPLLVASRKSRIHIRHTHQTPIPTSMYQGTEIVFTGSPIIMPTKLSVLLRLLHLFLSRCHQLQAGPPHQLPHHRPLAETQPQERVQQLRLPRPSFVGRHQTGRRILRNVLDDDVARCYQNSESKRVR
jgi:hypothetical protein